MGILFSCCRKSKGGGEYKKIDEKKPDTSSDLEAGGADDDEEEEWDDFGPEADACSSSRHGNANGNSSSSSRPCDALQAHMPQEPPEPEPEPEPDPFAGFDMAPKIVPTKRHAATSVWAKPKVPSSGLFAMTDGAAEDASVGGGGWDGDDLGDFGAAERRRAAEERRNQRRKEREHTGEGAAREKPRLAAVRGASSF